MGTLPGNAERGERRILRLPRNESSARDCRQHCAWRNRLYHRLHLHTSGGACISYSDGSRRTRRYLECIHDHVGRGGWNGCVRVLDMFDLAHVRAGGRVLPGLCDLLLCRALSGTELASLWTPTSAADIAIHAGAVTDVKRLRSLRVFPRIFWLTVHAQKEWRTRKECAWSCRL